MSCHPFRTGAASGGIDSGSWENALFGRGRGSWRSSFNHVGKSLSLSIRAASAPETRSHVASLSSSSTVGSPTETPSMSSRRAMCPPNEVFDFISLRLQNSVNVGCRRRGGCPYSTTHRFRASINRFSLLLRTMGSRPVAAIWYFLMAL